MSDAPALFVLLVALGLVAWFALRKQRAREAIWNTLATRHALQRDRDTLQGAAHGRALRIAHEVRGSSKTRYDRIVVQCALTPPLALGLRIRVRGDARADVAELDEHLRIEADDPARVHALLTPALRQCWLDACAQPCELIVSDTQVRLETAGTLPDTAWIEWAIDLALRTSTALDEVRESPRAR